MKISFNLMSYAITSNDCPRDALVEGNVVGIYPTWTGKRFERNNFNKTCPSDARHSHRVYLQYLR